jgi:hypothetical protein
MLNWALRVISQQPGRSIADICMWFLAYNSDCYLWHCLVPLPAHSNSCVITRSEVVTVREITRWQNKSQNGGTKFYYMFRLLVSLGFKLIISRVLLPSTEARPHTKQQIANFVFQLFSSQACEINYLRPWPAAARRHRGISKPFAMYRGADKSLARPTSLCILFDGENISFDASHVIYMNSTNIHPIMIINRICETQNLQSL